MLNGDFEGVDLVQGKGVRISNTGREEVKVFVVKDDLESVQWQGPVDEIPRLWRPTVDSAMTLYKKCMLLEGRTEGEGRDTAVCVPGLGWCNVRGKRIQMFFEDGVRMEVDLETREIVYCDIRRRKERWKLGGEDLPRHVLQRLEQCEVFKDVE
jgi:hypothetical protein